MTKFGKWSLILGIIIILIVVIFILQKKPVEDETPINPDLASGTMPAIEGNVDDLVTLSFDPNTTLSGVVSYDGSVKGAYFFEANVQINILDVNKNVLKTGFATATTEWMTADAVSFSGTIDLTGLPVGPAYFEIHNDNASGLPENDKSIQIPITIQ